MSNLNEKKAKTLFSRFDVDGNGSLEEDDIKKWSEKLIEIRNVEPERQDEIRDQMKHIWIAFFQPADKDNDGKIEYSELLDYLVNV
jgi:Ca2+-binding EF-hand superfamily protein